MTLVRDAEILWQNYREEVVSDLIVSDAPSKDINNNYSQGKDESSVSNVGSTLTSRKFACKVDYLFGVLNKMQRSMETLNKRFMDVETLVFDLIDENRCPLRSGVKAEKAVQTDTLMGGQGILNHLSRSILKPIDVNPSSFFHVNSKTVKPKSYEKFNFDYLSSLSENEECKADKSSERKDSPTEANVNGLCVTKQFPKFKNNAQTSNDKLRKNTRRSIWSRDSDSDVSNEESENKAQKSPTIKDNIPDEMKSNVSLPWHMASKRLSNRSNVNGPFFGEYILPPHPRAQSNAYLPNAPRPRCPQLPTRCNGHNVNSGSQRSNSPKTCSNTIKQKENNSVHKNQYLRQQHYSNPHAKSCHNAQPSDDAFRSHCNGPNRHHRRLLEASKRNAGYTCRGTGIFTSEDEEDAF